MKASFTASTPEQLGTTEQGCLISELERGAVHHDRYGACRWRRACKSLGRTSHSSCSAESKASGVVQKIFSLDGRFPADPTKSEGRNQSARMRFAHPRLGTGNKRRAVRSWFRMPSGLSSGPPCVLGPPVSTEFGAMHLLAFSAALFLGGGLCSRLCSGWHIRNAHLQESPFCGDEKLIRSFWAKAYPRLGLKTQQLRESIA